MSGILRKLPDGTPFPLCQLGFAVPLRQPVLFIVEHVLGPPEPAHSCLFELVAHEPVVGEAPPAQLSFQGISGIYDFAESQVPAILVLLKYVDWLPTSLKSVPPTATLNGVDAIPFTA